MQIELDVKQIINCLGYVKRKLHERGKLVEFTDLKEFQDSIESTVSGLPKEELELYGNALSFAENMRNQNPNSYQKVMQLIKAIIEKSEKSTVKTSQIRAIKKEKLQAKKEAGEFVPKVEFKKTKTSKKENKVIKEKHEGEIIGADENIDDVDASKMKADFKKSKQVLNKKLMSQNKKSADDAKSGEVSALGLK